MSSHYPEKEASVSTVPKIPSIKIEIRPEVLDDCIRRDKENERKMYRKEYRKNWYRNKMLDPVYKEKEERRLNEKNLKRKAQGIKNRGGRDKIRENFVTVMGTPEGAFKRGALGDARREFVKRKMDEMKNARVFQASDLTDECLRQLREDTLFAPKKGEPSLMDIAKSFFEA